ncbi:MAG: CPBP family intramembrane glutamic endopeptidase [Candidatus Dormibacteria bacterium]
MQAIARRRHDPTAAAGERAWPLLGALALAVLVRVGLGGGAAAASPSAAVAFSLVLLGAVVRTRWRPPPPRWEGVALGTGGAVALVALSFAGLLAVHVGARAGAAVLAWWVPLVTVVAASEELVLRGVLFDALRHRSGDVVAVTVTALAFAAIHLPLYGIPALGIDLGVGVFLGCLRIVSGGVAAPLCAHVLADLATGWLG